MSNQNRVGGNFKNHEGDSACEFVKAMKIHGVDQQVYYSGTIVGDHCLSFDKNGNLIIDSMTKAMKPKFKDANNLQHIAATRKSLKHIVKLWYKTILVIEPVEKQSNRTIAQFKIIIIELNKAIHTLAPLVPGFILKHSKLLKGHLLFN